MLFLFLQRLARSEEGQDLLEYGILATMIALFAMGTVGFFGSYINQFYWQTIGAASI
ncbi:MAG TPA: hypothetical protein VJM31_11800 [Vicinamibacterales bacterium]|nr:hypothetical protein [Vicinamibacterales bacterium]